MTGKTIKLKSPEERLVYFIDMLKDSGRIRFKNEFFDKTGIKRQYYTKVRNGEIRFTTNHISQICKHYNLNANWVFGTQDNMFLENI